MPRRREVTKREILPDPKYKSVLVSRFVNNLMKQGKKSTAERILYHAFDYNSGTDQGRSPEAV